MKLPVALTIAGSDSGGGAGIQADLKTFASLGVHGASALTAVTAQNTVAVTLVEELSPEVVRAQIDAVVGDLGVQAAKTGMLSSARIIGAVVEAVRAHAIHNLVVDPVMVAKGGARLLSDDAVAVLRRDLLPLALVVTPNLPEAEALLGHPVKTVEERQAAARELASLGPKIVVVKGGHAEGDPIDFIWDGTCIVALPARRVATANTHGSGCAFSAAIAAGLARGLAPGAATEAAKEFITAAIEASIEVGRGHGPVNPMYSLRR